MPEIFSSRGRARIGVLVPFTNTNLEPDLALMKPDGVSLHIARLGGYDEHEVPDENQMMGLGESDIEEPLRLLSGVKPDVVIYGCTSATLTHGPEFDRALALKIHDSISANTVTAAGALVNALAHLDAKSIGYCSPYVTAINDLAVDFLSHSNVLTVKRSEVRERLGNDGQGALLPDQILELSRAADHPDAEAIVLSCTDMRSVEIVQKLEDEIGKPVITSNQAMMFQTMQLLGFDDPISGFGRLLEGVANDV